MPKPKPTPDAESSLHKLGQRLRAGFAKQHPVQEKTIETVKDTVREQYQQEQEMGRKNTSALSIETEKQRQTPEPDQDR